MCGIAPSSLDNLQHSVCIGCTALDGDSQDSKEKNLDCSTRSIPKGTRNAILPSNIGGLQKSSGPGPLTDNDIGNQTCLDRPASCVKVLGCGVVGSEPVLEPHKSRGNDGENHTEKDDHAVT